MRLQNTISDFLTLYESKEQFTTEDLEIYFNEHPDVLAQYFPNHCPRTEQRRGSAIEKYPGEIDEIRTFSKRLPRIIEEIDMAYTTAFNDERFSNFINCA